MGCLTQVLALFVSHVAAPGELAVLSKPSITTNTAATGAKAMATTDVFVHVLTLPIITLTVFAMNTAVSWGMACALSTCALTSAMTGQVRGPSAFSQTGFHRA